MTAMKCAVCGGRLSCIKLRFGRPFWLHVSDPEPSWSGPGHPAVPTPA